MTTMQQMQALKLSDKAPSMSDSWSGLARFSETQSKIQEVLGRHGQLEQSEAKAQAMLLTILSLTQITELKLLLDIGSQGNRFYILIFSLLIACICLEVLAGIIVIYVGNIRYNESDNSRIRWRCSGRRHGARGYDRSRRYQHRGVYQSVSTSAAMMTDPHTAGTAPVSVVAGGCGIDLTDDDQDLLLPAVSCCLCCQYTARDEDSRNLLTSAVRRDEEARYEIQLAEATVKLFRARNVTAQLEEALRSSPGDANLEARLAAAGEDLRSAARDRSEAETRRALAQNHHAAVVSDMLAAELGEKQAFRRMCYWQHFAMYFIYIVILLNIFIGTFGISGSSGHASAHSEANNNMGPSTVAAINTGHL